MIYTVGHLASYLKGAADAKAEGKRVKKVGRNNKPDWIEEGYEGGIVFRTREAAEAYIRAFKHTEYAVFGLEADWETGTAPHSTGAHRCLLNHTPVVFLDDHLTGE